MTSSIYFLLNKLRATIWTWLIIVLRPFFSRYIHISFIQKHQNSGSKPIFGSYNSELFLPGNQVKDAKFIRCCGIEGQYYSPLSTGAIIAEEVAEENNLYGKIPVLIESKVEPKKKVGIKINRKRK